MTSPTSHPVLIPSALLSYTAQQAWVQAQGQTLGEVLDDLDRQFPGLRFRVIDEQDHVRRHMRVFIEGRGVERLSHPLAPGVPVYLVLALSGG